MGKPWENGGCSWDLMEFTQPGNDEHSELENDHRNSGFSHL